MIYYTREEIHVIKEWTRHGHFLPSKFVQSMANHCVCTDTVDLFAIRCSKQSPKKKKKKKLKMILILVVIGIDVSNFVDDGRI